MGINFEESTGVVYVVRPSTVSLTTSVEVGTIDALTKMILVTGSDKDGDGPVTKIVYSIICTSGMGDEVVTCVVVDKVKVGRLASKSSKVDTITDVITVRWLVWVVFGFVWFLFAGGCVVFPLCCLVMKTFVSLRCTLVYRWRWSCQSRVVGVVPLGTR